MRRLVFDLWPVALLLLLWQAWVSAAGYNSIVLVPPGAVLSDLLHSPGAYLVPVLHTLIFALGGLAMGMTAGLLLALAAWLSELLAGITTPFALLLSSTPVVCLIPIIARLFGYEGRTELIAIAVMTFFPSFVYCSAGLRQLPAMSRDVFLVLHASRWQTLRLLALPAALPALATALRVGATYSVLVALLAEYLMQTGGLGALFAVTMQQFHLARALGASVLAMALSVLLFEATRAIERRVAAFYRGVFTLLLAVLVGTNVPAAGSLRIDPHALGTVARTEDRFQSYNVEMAEVIGARFWKPYAHMAAGDRAAAEIQVGSDPDLFEQRSPLDLGSHRLRALAAALGPAYMRVSGTWANSVYFQNDDAAPLAKPPEGFRGVLTRAQWRGVIEFAKAVDAKLVTSFTISSGVRDATGAWTPLEAQPLLDFTRSIGGEIFAAELFNEPNLPSVGAGPPHYDAAWFARDVAAFRAFMAAAAPGLRVVGPGDAGVGVVSLPGPLTPGTLLAAKPTPKFDVFSYHYYGAVSQRCAPPHSPGAATQEQALSDAWLSRTDQVYDHHAALRDRFAPRAPTWITETAEAACGGDPWAATFADSFRYLDQMARLAKRGAGAIFHNTLAASEYGLIDQTTLDPRPNYWAALLWRRLMGPVVLDAGRERPHLHIYAQCLDRSGGVSLLALNMSGGAALLDVSGPTETYLLTPSSDNAAALLNGRTLMLGANDRIPALAPKRRQGRVILPPGSIGFIAVPKAENPNCR